MGLLAYQASSRITLIAVAGTASWVSRGRKNSCRPVHLAVVHVSRVRAHTSSGQHAANSIYFGTLA
jgi:hypothetical protein